MNPASSKLPRMLPRRLTTTRRLQCLSDRTILQRRSFRTGEFQNGSSRSGNQHAFKSDRTPSHQRARVASVNWTAFNLTLLTAGGALLWWHTTAAPLRADAPQEGSETFQGKPIILAPGGEKRIAHDERTGEDIELVPTGTSSVPHFPKTIFLPKQSTASGALPAQATPSQNANHPGEEEYTLVGLGIRTVSFLSIQVYVVGLYVATKSLQQLQSRLIKRVNPTASALIPGEKEDLRNALLDGQTSLEIWDELLRDTRRNILDRDGVSMALRIVPTRGTDFNHLRDGWVRGITGRVQQAQKDGSNEYSDEAFGATKKDFERLLSGKGKAPKGSIVVLTRAADGKLGVRFQAKERDGKVEHFGDIDDDRLSRLIWLVYFGGKSVSSESTRKSVADGCVALVERPVGTVETKVE